MRKGVLLVALCAAFMATSAHAAVGKHNGFIALTGGFLYDQLISVEGSGAPAGSYQDQLGGSVGFDLGYQYYSQGKFVNGVDLVFGMTFGFQKVLGFFDGTTYNPANFADGESAGLRSTTAYLGSTYSAGFHAAGTRFMFDVIGLRLEFGGLQFVANTGGVSMDATAESVFNIGINLPLGFRAVMDNGFLIGFRHAVSVNVAAYGDAEMPFLVRNGERSNNLLSYSFQFSLGYAFGKN
ncbi:MAG: hypothetical protein ACRCY4_09960 [Brevinema sp.]